MMTDQALNEELLDAELEKYRDRDVVVRLRCAACDFVIDQVAAHPRHPALMRWDTKARALSAASAKRRGVSGPLTQRARPALVGSDDRGVDRWSYSCTNKRCKATPTVRMDRLVLRYLEAVKAGRHDLWLS